MTAYVKNAVQNAGNRIVLSAATVDRRLLTDDC